MPAVINSIKPGSIAEDLDIRAGDELISIDGIELRDLLDYRYLNSSEEITLCIKRSDGSSEIFDIEKDENEDIGINFESAVFDKVIPCNNRCVFCFVDQQPSGLRESLYVKDDDYRLSYLQGTYITLTNLNSKDKRRIENLKIGPLYISVHTTNPELRSVMLQNPKAKNIAEKLKWLNNLDIPIHTQIVLCPGFNDGDDLDKTLNDLADLKSNILSIAVVPVGITKYRQDNSLIRVTKAKAKEVILQIERFNKNIGYNLALPSDEFYILAECDFPKASFYGEFGQLDDGVGSSRLLLDDFSKNKLKLPKSLSEPKEFHIATGLAAYDTINQIAASLNKIKNLKVSVIPIKSSFWGEHVTATGLITGSDLLDNLLPVKSQIKNLILPSVMLRKHTNLFLDDLTVEDIQNKLACRIHQVENRYNFADIIKIAYFLLDKRNPYQ